MRKEKRINKDLGEKQANSGAISSSEQDAFFSNPDMFTIHKKTNPVDVLEFIKSKSPISIWDICKCLNINRNTIYYLLRDLEFAGLIRSKLRRNKNNRRVRIIYYNKTPRPAPKSPLLEMGQDINKNKSREVKNG